MMIKACKKRRLLYVDNFNASEVEKISKIYSDILFFTTDGHIWKNGIEYTNKPNKLENDSTTIDYIDSNHNKIYDYSNMYTLEILDKDSEIGLVKTDNPYFDIKRYER